MDQHLASFCVEKFGTERMLDLSKKEDVHGRMDSNLKA